MRKTLIFISISMLAAVACTKDINENPVKEEMVFHAISTKTTLSGNNIKFNSGDKVCVFSNSENFMFRTVDDGSSASFRGEAIKSDKYYILYPYDENASISGNAVTFDLPAVQKALPNSYDPAAFASVASTDDDTFYLLNVCALMKISVFGNWDKMVLRNGHPTIPEPFAGHVSVNVEDNAPVLARVENGSPSVTLIREKDTPTNGDFYFSVLPQNLSAGFAIDVYCGDEITKTIDFTKVHIKMLRSELLNLGSVDLTVEDEPLCINMGSWSHMENGTALAWSSINMGAEQVGDMGKPMTYDEAIRAIEVWNTKYNFDDVIGWRLPTTSDISRLFVGNSSDPSSTTRTWMQHPETDFWGWQLEYNSYYSGNPSIFLSIPNDASECIYWLDDHNSALIDKKGMTLDGIKDSDSKYYIRPVFDYTPIN